jgi:hypothetical protein
VPAVAEPRVLEGSTLVLPPRIGGVDNSFLSAELPRLNNAISEGHLGIADFAEVIGARLSATDLEALVRIGDRLDPLSTLYVLGGMGAIASSIVRHVRVVTGDNDTSAGLDLIPGLEETLLAFGRFTNRAPRDNHDTTWALGFPATFTGSDDEIRFGRAVREANRLLGASEQLLMPLRTGDIAIVDAVELLEQATTHVREYTHIQSDLAVNAFPKSFLEMRKYLGTYRVGGDAFEGPNATYTGGWTGFELALGLLEDFRSTARYRTRFMSVEDRLRIEASSSLPTLCEVVAEELGFAGSDLARADPCVLGLRVSAAPVPVRRAVLAASALAKATAHMAAAHAGAIRKNLVDPVSAMAEVERAKLGVSPDGGVSGTPLEHTFQQRKKRLAHPLIRMLVPTAAEEKEERI